jgi:GTP-binding protein EngB required for normal cell division
VIKLNNLFFIIEIYQTDIPGYGFETSKEAKKYIENLGDNSYFVVNYEELNKLIGDNYYTLYNY